MASTALVRSGLVSESQITSLTIFNRFGKSYPSINITDDGEGGYVADFIRRHSKLLGLDELIGRKPNMALEFIVGDVFRFEDGRTVFTGRLVSEFPYLKPCRADLLVDDVLICSVFLEEEMMPLHRKDRLMRSVSTRDEVPIDLKSVSRGRLVLRLFE